MPRRDLVVVGASAGGVRALRALTAALPADFDAAMCVVLHVGAFKSTLPELLAAVQQEAAENALWSAVRSLQEKELLLRKIAELDRSAGDEAHARQSETEADDLRKQADTLRRLVEKG
ncbi:chemotaxis protein CheB [Azohydromonas lata]|uniref:chemotaxis protein CheB n=1 Tax=Azohydromonas lata TaxID=45677 RepID=UPI0012F51018|nr:chemotaxis protein CheB [Azohydromonas lata]